MTGANGTYVPPQSSSGGFVSFNGGSSPPTRPTELNRAQLPLQNSTRSSMSSNGTYAPPPTLPPALPLRPVGPNGVNRPSPTSPQSPSRLPPRPPRKPDTLRAKERDQTREIESSGEDITFTKHDVIIAVMGVTGAGKSTFISLLSDEKIEIGHGLQSCTTKVGVYYFIYRGVRIFLVDTPGFDDTNRSDSEVLKDVAFWLAAAYKQETRLAGIIYLHRISDPRMQGSALRNLRMFNKLCGANNLSSVILATTHWTSAVSESTGEVRMKELVQTPEFWGSMVDRGSRVVKHDGSRQSALQIVSNLVDRRVRVILDIQRQLIDQKLNLNDTDAAQALQGELIAERKKFEARMSELRDDMEFAMKEKDVKWQEAIKIEQAKNKAEIEKTYAETEALRTNLKKIAEEKDAQFRELQAQMERQRLKYEDDIKKSTEAINAAREESQRRTAEYERQRKADAAKAERVAKEHQQNMSAMESRMRKESSQAILAQMERERQDSEQRYQQQRDDAAVAAAAEARRWEEQQEMERRRQQHLEDERDEANRRMAELEKEQKRSKGFTLSAIKAVCNVVSLGLALTGSAPWRGFWQ